MLAGTSVSQSLLMNSSAWLFPFARQRLFRDVHFFWRFTTQGLDRQWGKNQLLIIGLRLMRKILMPGVINRGKN